MIQRIYTMSQKPSAGWNTMSKTGWRVLLEDCRGSAFDVVLLGIAISIAAILIFVNSVDFALYSYKRSRISKAIDYGVSAAVQEIDQEKSRDGLAEGFDAHGNISLERVYLHEERADNAFFSTFKNNTGIDRSQIQSRILVALVHPTNLGLDCKIKWGTESKEETVRVPTEVEGLLNTRINEFWNPADPEADRHLIYVNGNFKTNPFGKKPYYLVFLKDYPIEGLFRKRTATFVGFKGAKVDRKSN